MARETPDIVGRYIRITREKRGFAQKDLAELAEVPQSLLSQIETGARRGSTIQLDAARRMAMALGVSLDALSGMKKEDDDGEMVPTGLAEAWKTA
jgi:transcriptional regulator with XRE-family HTH domain